MNRLLLSFFIFYLSMNSFTQDIYSFERKQNETKEEYILRVKPSDVNLTYNILESYEWDPINSSIICFYEIPRDRETESEIVGYVYMKQYDVEYYRDIVFGEFIGESLYPEIIDVFWLNIDNDEENELFVLFRYYVSHYDFTGFIYDLSILDNPQIVDGALSLITKFGSEFISFEGTSGDGVESFPLYTTKEAVIKKISEFGYSEMKKS